MPEMYEFNAAKCSDGDPGNGPTTRSGWHCSVAVGFLFVLLAVAIAVGVGIIVHFAGGDNDVTCHYQGVPSTDMNVMTCIGLASQAENRKICDSCPETTTATTTTTSPDVQTTTTTTTMTTTAPPTPRNQRLPTALTPILYTLYLMPDFYWADQAFWSLPGHSTVLVSCQEITSLITMHIKDIDIEESSIAVRLVDTASSVPAAGANLYESYSLEEASQFLHIRTTESMVQGNNYTVSITYTSRIRNDLTGVYITTYQRGGSPVYVVTTQLEATEARKVLPCFDEPAMKAQFDITVARHPDMVVLSNMPLKSTTNVSSTDPFPWVDDTFERTPVMSTYLLAITVSDYTYRQVITNDGLQVRLWARPEAINQTEYGVRIGAEILPYLQGYFDTRFPITKQDFFAVNDHMSWAMENWGLITFKEETILYQETKTSPSEQFLLTIRLSHELSHNWFGNLVSPAWWDDLWLNEGFATFVSTIGVDLVQPDWKVGDFFIHFITRPALFSDSLVVSHPLYMTGVSDPDEIMSSFDNIMYEKGASVIRMMSFMLGKDTFKRGLQRYLKANAFGNSKHSDLWNSLTKQAEEDGNKFTDVKGVMDTWVKQMNYPIVNVEILEGGNIRLTQRRYLVNPDAADPNRFPSDFGFTWEIPFTYTTSVEKHFDKTSNDITMMHINDSAVSIQSDTIPAPTGDNWVIGNLQYLGFFRVNYDARNWAAIIKQLNTDHTVIHTLNRVQILLDTWSFSKSGELDLVTALRAAEYITMETELAPWNTFLANIDELNNVLYKFPVYGPIKNYLKDILGSVYSNYAITSTNSNRTFIERYKRQLVVEAACSVDLDLCVSQARQQFQQWSNGLTAHAPPGCAPGSLEPAVAGTVYCTGVRLGGEMQWNYVFTKYKQENLRSEKYYMLKALTCTQEPWLIAKIMNMALEGKDILISDLPKTFEYLSSNTVAAPMMWDFFRTHYERILQQNGPYWGLVALQHTVTHFNGQRQIEELENFSEAVDIGDALLYLNALAKANVTRRWLDGNLYSLAQWLADNGY